MKINKVFHHFILVFGCLLILTGCPGMADYDIDLPGDYSVVRTSGHNIIIAPKISDHLWGMEVIPAKVTEVASDERYILAKQLGLMRSPNSSSSYAIPNIDDENYWILDFMSNEVYGPMNHDDFIDKKNELGITEEIKLKDVEKLR